MDWVDWMLPEAWNLEHNKLHHYKLSEDADPDCVERNFANFRAMKVPRALKWIPMPIFLVGWKYIYYSTNTFKQYKLSQKNSFIARNWPSHPGAQTHSAPLVAQNFIVSHHRLPLVSAPESPAGSNQRAPYLAAITRARYYLRL